ncbi:BrnT family toxin [Myxosarcina sp. GI1(2024)]
MRIEEIIWLDKIIDKLAVKHRVNTNEVEEVLSNKPKFRFVEKGDRAEEDVYLALGQTDSGRYKFSNQALILSARDMPKKERKLYDRK